MDARTFGTDGIPNLHDWELHAVLMDRHSKTLKLGFRSPDSEATIEISFENIVTYKINNIQHQNVVSRIIVSDTSHDAECLDRLTRWASSGAEGRLIIPERNLAAILERIHAGELGLFYVDPSWGAEIGVIYSKAAACGRAADVHRLRTAGTPPHGVEAAGA